MKNSSFFVFLVLCGVNSSVITASAASTQKMKKLNFKSFMTETAEQITQVSTITNADIGEFMTEELSFKRADLGSKSPAIFFNYAYSAELSVVKQLAYLKQIAALKLSVSVASGIVGHVSVDLTSERPMMPEPSAR